VKNWWDSQGGHVVLSTGKPQKKIPPKKCAFSEIKARKACYNNFKKSLA